MKETVINIGPDSLERYAAIFFVGNASHFSPGQAAGSGTGTGGSGSGSGSGSGTGSGSGSGTGSGSGSSAGASGTATLGAGASGTTSAPAQNTANAAPVLGSPSSLVSLFAAAVAAFALW